MSLVVLRAPADARTGRGRPGTASVGGADAVFASAEPLITSLLDGYNVCVMAYGRTAAGKTYTLMGPHAVGAAAPPSPDRTGAHDLSGSLGHAHATSTRDTQRGLIPRSIQKLFQQMRGVLDTHSFKVSVRPVRWD